MLPYWFSAMTMKSVGKAALAMVEEVRRQFNTIQGLMDGSARPDYRQCVEISTQVKPPSASKLKCVLQDAFASKLEAAAMHLWCTAVHCCVCHLAGCLQVF